MEPVVEDRGPIDLSWLSRTLADVLEDEIARPRNERDPKAIVLYSRVLRDLITPRESSTVRVDGNTDENPSAAPPDLGLTAVRDAIRAEIRAGAGNVPRATIA
jgi:hypothetical protein